MDRVRHYLIGVCLAVMVSVAAGEPEAPQEHKGPRLPDGFVAARNLAYVENGHKAQVLDLYYPEKSEKNLPLVVWIHGGAWSAGSKNVGPPQLWLLEKGYAVASVEYRFSQVAPFPAQIHDCKAAIRWLRAHANEYHLDAEHIGVWGSSAGGHLVALLGTSGEVKELEGDLGNNNQSSRVQAVCDFFGPSDIGKMGAQSGENSKMNHDEPKSPESRLLGGPVQENLDKAAKASPLTYVSKDDAPFLIMHGDQDPLVPLKQSQTLADALKAVGVPVMLAVIQGAGHGGKQFDSAENRDKVLTFFDKCLKK